MENPAKHMTSQMAHGSRAVELPVLRPHKTLCQAFVAWLPLKESLVMRHS